MTDCHAEAMTTLRVLIERTALPKEWVNRNTHSIGYQNQTPTPPYSRNPKMRGRPTPGDLDTMGASDNEGITKEAYYTYSRPLEPAWIGQLVA